MDGHTNESRYGAKSVESRRTDLASSPLKKGSPRRSGGTLLSHRGTRAGESRLHDTGTLKILQWNAEGLQHKKSALAKVLQDGKIDIACIQETHLNENMRCTIRGYQSFRKDRKGHKGGVIIFIKNDIAVNENLTDVNLELLSIKLAKYKTQYTIYNCYCPPTECLPLEDIETQDESFIVVGDFNSHSPSWGYEDLNTRGEELENWITDNNLQLLMNEDDPDTYFSRAWKTTSNPDLALMTDDLTGVSTRKVLNQLAGSDHRPILIEITESPNDNARPPPPRWNYKKAKWDEFSYLTDKYTQNIHCRSKKIDETTKEFTLAILRAATDTIPRGSRANYCPGWTDKLDALNNRVSESRKKAERNPSHEHITAYKMAEKELKEEIITNKREAWHEKTRQLDYDKDGKKLWNLVKTLNGEENRYAAPSVEDQDGNILTKRQAANSFIEQYKCVGKLEIEYTRKQEVKREIKKLKGQDAKKENTDEIMFKRITEEEVNTALKSLTKNKAPGPDKITNNMLMNLGRAAKSQMRKLFNASWRAGRLPQIWKQAIMIPIKKHGKPKASPQSYRPISLTSCLGKLMEKIINTRLLWYLEANEIITDDQAGFRQFRSTEDQITYIAQQIEDAFQDKKQTVTVWVDMEKAFDKVWTKGLLLKLKRAKVSHNMYSWIKNYLTNRKARVQVQNTTSRLTTIKNGVPQGGVLSPTLFILFINDIWKIKCRGVKGAIYADDLALLCSENNLGAAKERLQMTLDELSKWTEEWGMKVNANKTTYTIFSLSTKRKEIKLTLYGKQLIEDQAPKYLGVKFDPRLTWKLQTDDCQRKGMQRMQLLRKLAGTTWGANTSVLKKTYLGYVRPALEYGITAWGTCSNNQLSKVEKVQNHCLRIITGAIKTTPIHKMETHTGVRALSEQRDEKVLTQYSKMKFMSSQPLHQNTKRNGNKRLKRNNFISMGQKLEKTHNLVPTQPITEIQIPKGKHPLQKTHCELNINRDKSKMRNKDEAMLMLDSLYPKTEWVRVYTDGSVRGTMRRGGSGVYVEWIDGTTTQKSLPAGNTQTSCVAEGKAILLALKTLFQSQNTVEKSVVILTDCDDLLQAIEDPQCVDTRDILESISNRFNRITFQWIPGHVGIRGNTIADRLAKEAATQEQPQTPISFQQQKSIIKQTFKQDWQNKHPDYNKHDPVFSLKRSSQVVIFRLRTGHNQMRQHLYTKLGAGDSPYCPCNTAFENTGHVLMDCPLYQVQRTKHWPSETTLHTKLYGESDDLQRTTDFIADIGMQL